MNGKRGTARQWSKEGAIDDSGANQVYFALRDAVDIEQEHLPTLDGPATVFPREKTVIAGDPLPHPDDVRAVLMRASGKLKTLSAARRELRPLVRALCRHLTEGLQLGKAFGYQKRGRGAPRHRELVRAGLVRALTVLDTQRFRRPELRYLKLALRRHLELDLTLDQAFGYARAAPGAAPFAVEREQRIACAVFERRFIAGLNAEIAAYEAGQKFDVSKTQALEAFTKHAVQALAALKFERLRKIHPQLVERHARGDLLAPEELQTLKSCRLWTDNEEQRLKRYYGPD